jgi:cytochrome c-type biogenesis protein
MTFFESLAQSDVPLIAAFFMGFLVSASPCTLASNVTAIAYVSRRMRGWKEALIAGLLYTLGRVLTYVALASLFVYAGRAALEKAVPLQGYATLALGIVLLSLGFVMLGALRLPQASFGSAAFKERIASRGYYGGFFLGVLSALAFCPMASITFFALLVPLAAEAHDPLFVPAVFAIATGMPVIVFSVLYVSGATYLGKAMNAAQLFEKWTRYFVAFLFFIGGMYYLALWFFS